MYGNHKSRLIIKFKTPNRKRMGSLLLKTIVQQLNYYVRSVTKPSLIEPGKDLVLLGNIAASQFAGGNGNNSLLEEKIVVSLVNISEEGSLKNNHHSRKINQQHFTYHPVVHVNLYLLFTANFTKYDDAIDHLFRVLEFFQGRKIFKFKNAPITGMDDAGNLAEIEITLDLHTLNFEQLNDLWGSLGGKQLPFVIYRARLMPVMMEQPLNQESLITNIDLSTNNVN